MGRTTSGSFQIMNELQEQIRQCRRCRETFGFEPRPIVRGNAHAPIMQISQAPGRKVHETGIPFNDQSGKRLRRQWYEIEDEVFYDPDLFYITTVGHCFPGKSKNGRNDNRPPKCCYDLWTRKEIEKKPDTELYVIIGKEAADRIFGKKDFADLVFHDQTLNGKPAVVLPHPSPLNRKWFADHPAFEQERMPEIRKRVHEILKRHQKSPS